MKLNKNNETYERLQYVFSDDAELTWSLNNSCIAVLRRIPGCFPAFIELTKEALDQVTPALYMIIISAIKNDQRTIASTWRFWHERSMLLLETNGISTYLSRLEDLHWNSEESARPIHHEKITITADVYWGVQCYAYGVHYTEADQSLGAQFQVDAAIIDANYPGLIDAIITGASIGLTSEEVIKLHASSSWGETNDLVLPGTLPVYNETETSITSLGTK